MLTSMNARRAALWICVLFTLLTVTSSTWQLLQGVEHDTHLHLLARFAVTVVGVSSLALFGALHQRFHRAAAVKAAAGAYVISMAVVLTLTWGFGQLEPLHPDAYRDIVSNFTAVWLVVAVVVILTPRTRQRFRARRPQVSDTTAE